MTERDLEPLPSIRWIERPDQARSLLDPLRSTILTHLRQPGSSTSVAGALGLPRQRVNYHVRALEEEGLLEHVEDRRKGNCVERLVRASAQRYIVDPEVFGAEASRSDTEDSGRSDPFTSEGLVAGASRTLRDVADLEARVGQLEERPPALALERSVRFRSRKDEIEFAAALRESLDLLRDRYHDADAAEGRSFRIAIAGHLDPAELDPR